jgi:hypothetical protein
MLGLTFGAGPPGDSSPPEYTVTGQIVPPVNDRGYSLITLDGYKSGEVRDLSVINNNATWTPNACPTGSSTLHMVVVSTTNSAGCIPGDSGGPMYQHESSNFNYVDAVGDIDESEGSTSCWGEQIGYETTDSNTRLMIAP